MLPPPQHNFILFELDFDVKFPLLRLLLFLSDSNTIVFIQRQSYLLVFFFTKLMPNNATIKNYVCHDKRNSTLELK